LAIEASVADDKSNTRLLESVKAGETEVKNNHKYTINLRSMADLTKDVEAE
jgi:hypothetical protein